MRGRMLWAIVSPQISGLCRFDLFYKGLWVMQWCVGLLLLLVWQRLQQIGKWLDVFWHWVPGAWGQAALVGEGATGEIDVAIRCRRIGFWFFTTANCNDNKLFCLMQWEFRFYGSFYVVRCFWCHGYWPTESTAKYMSRRLNYNLGPQSTIKVIYL